MMLRCCRSAVDVLLAQAEPYHIAQLQEAQAEAPTLLSSVSRTGSSPRLILIRQRGRAAVEKTW